MKVFQIWFHDYMDLKASDSLYTFATQADADAYVKHMRKNWCSGTTSNAKMLTKEEVIKLANEPRWRKQSEDILALLNKCDY